MATPVVHGVGHDAYGVLYRGAMDANERLLPSSPAQSVQAVDASTDTVAVAPIEDEKTPLLGGGNRDVEVVGKEQTSKRRLNWKSLTLVGILWFAILSIGAAYSMIAPFFPKEASSYSTL